MTRPFFLAIEGPIGVGKTTLARLLEPRLEAGLLLEAFAENPFLSEFYADRARYAFQTQLFFLLSRYKQHQSIPALLTRGSLIADYTFAKDSLFAHLNLKGDELEMYERLHGVLADRTPVPDLVIYLRADTDVLMVRVAARDRVYERDMDRAYMESVRQAYEDSFADYARTPLLTVDTNDLNYVRDSGALTVIESQVRTALGIGPYQRPFPQMEPRGPARRPTAVTGTACAVPEHEAVREFVRANEAMARVEAALADGVSGRSGEVQMELRTMLEDAMARLRRLARAIGSELGQTQ